MVASGLNVGLGCGVASYSFSVMPLMRSSQVNLLG